MNIIADKISSYLQEDHDHWDGLDHDKVIDFTHEVLIHYLAQKTHLANKSGVSPDLVIHARSILVRLAIQEQIQKDKSRLPEQRTNQITSPGTPVEAWVRITKCYQNAHTCLILCPVAGM